MQQKAFICSFSLFGLLYFPFFTCGETIKDIQARLNAIKNFAPAEKYQFDFEASTKNKKLTGRLMGAVNGLDHPITLEFDISPKCQLCFNKNHLQSPLLDGKPYPTYLWLNPIVECSGCCYFMLAMPFLDWEIDKFEPTAKRGRKVFKVWMKVPDNFCPITQVILYLDEHFNTLVEACAYDQQQQMCAQFVLQSLKKFNKKIWSVKSAQFLYRQHSTQMLITHATFSEI